MKYKRLALIIFLLLPNFCAAQRLPLWELGGALTYISIPHYRGAASNSWLALPVPIAAYRGEKYSLDEEGAHQWLFTSERVKLDISMAAGVPVSKSSQSQAREGMPGLDATIEIGPKLEINLFRKYGHSLSLNFPLRLVTSITWDKMQYLGWNFAPFAHYMYVDYGRNGGSFNLAVGPLYAAEKYHDYFYEVAPRYQTSERNAYGAREGYSGSRVTLYARKRFGRLWITLFGRYDQLSGAVFEDSPLIEQDHYIVAGMAIGWIFKKAPVYVDVKTRDRF